jgi:ubiquinone/menaquinone biosynthesis C-methylase UbiE
MTDDIVKYYNEGNEHERLRGNSIERVRTQELISRHLLGQSLTILDVGGATGIYSFWLSSMGHEVHLLDASPEHIRHAAEISDTSDYPLGSIAVGDARHIDFADEYFDAALMLGPMYHLTEREQRMEALEEVKRVMKPGATIFVAAISRFASMIDGFLYDYIEDPDFASMMFRDLEDGQHRSVSGKNYFTTSFFHLPKELESEIVDAGFLLADIYNVEGISEILPDLDEKLQSDDFSHTLMKAIRATETHEAFMGMTAHMLGVGLKREL